MKIGYLTIMLGLIALAIVINIQVQSLEIVNEFHQKDWSSEIYHETMGWKIAAILTSLIGLWIGIIGIKNYQKLSSIGVVLNLSCLISIFVPFYTFFISETTF